jgi:hypothetical protein
MSAFLASCSNERKFARLPGSKCALKNPFSSQQPQCLHTELFAYQIPSIYVRMKKASEQSTRLGRPCNAAAAAAAVCVAVGIGGVAADAAAAAVAVEGLGVVVEVVEGAEKQEHCLAVGTQTVEEEAGV